MHFFSFGTVLIVAAFLISGCNEPRLNSRWRDRDITIDGMDGEWEDSQRHYDKDTKTSIRVFNDSDYLYIGLVTTDRMIQRQIVGKRFTVWFDPKGGNDSQLGIRYPTGILGVGEAWERYEERSGRRIRRRGRSDSGEPAGEQTPLLEQMAKTLPTGFEIMVPQGDDDWDSIFVDEDQNVGIQAQLTLTKGRLAYELRIPIRKNDQMPYGLIISKRGRIGVGFETPTIDAKEMRKVWRRRRDRSGGEKGGSGKSGGKGGSDGKSRKKGKRRDFKKFESKSLELWTSVKLASRPSDAPSHSSKQLTKGRQ